VEYQIRAVKGWPSSRNEQLALDAVSWRKRLIRRAAKPAQTETIGVCCDDYAVIHAAELDSTTRCSPRSSHALISRLRHLPESSVSELPSLSDYGLRFLSTSKAASPCVYALDGGTLAQHCRKLKRACRIQYLGAPRDIVKFCRVPLLLLLFARRSVMYTLRIPQVEWSNIFLPRRGEDPRNRDKQFLFRLWCPNTALNRTQFVRQLSQ
jgi:hypothetical protein